MNSCVRRKFWGRLGKRVLEILGVIVGFCLFMAVLFVIGNWVDAWKYAQPMKIVCVSGVFILIVTVISIGIQEWCKETVRDCKWECENEERDANTSR